MTVFGLLSLIRLFECEGPAILFFEALRPRRSCSALALLLIGCALSR
jgi:hypothetical protein